MTAPPPRISLVVSAYQRDDFLDRVFVSLRDQTFRDFEVIVADDGSGAAMRAMIERWQGHFAHPIQHEWHEDNGFRKTIIVNRAVARARADYFVFIDGDCILHHRFLERHFKRRRKGRVLSGRRVMMDRELTERVTLEDIRSRQIERVSFWWKHAGKNDRRNGFYAPWAWGLRNFRRDDYQILGCNFSLHRNDFYRVNGYDERIVGRGLEDNNLRARLLNSGIVVKNLTHEALEYHCFHDSEPIPHDESFIEQFRESGETATPFGINKE